MIIESILASVIVVLFAYKYHVYLKERFISFVDILYGEYISLECFLLIVLVLLIVIKMVLKQNWKVSEKKSTNSESKSQNTNETKSESPISTKKNHETKIIMNENKTKEKVPIFPSKTPDSPGEEINEDKTKSPKKISNGTKTNTKIVETPLKENKTQENDPVSSKNSRTESNNNNFIHPPIPKTQQHREEEEEKIPKTSVFNDFNYFDMEDPEPLWKFEYPKFISYDAVSTVGKSICPHPKCEKVFVDGTGSRCRCGIEYCCFNHRDLDMKVHDLFGHQDQSNIIDFMESYFKRNIRKGVYGSFKVDDVVKILCSYFPYFVKRGFVSSFGPPKIPKRDCFFLFRTGPSQACPNLGSALSNYEVGSTNGQRSGPLKVNNGIVIRERREIPLLHESVRIYLYAVEEGPPGMVGNSLSYCFSQDVGKFLPSFDELGNHKNSGENRNNQYKSKTPKNVLEKIDQQLNNRTPPVTVYASMSNNENQMPRNLKQIQNRKQKLRKQEKSERLFKIGNNLGLSSSNTNSLLMKRIPSRKLNQINKFSSNFNFNERNKDNPSNKTQNIGNGNQDISNLSFSINNNNSSSSNSKNSGSGQNLHSKNNYFQDEEFSEEQEMYHISGVLDEVERKITRLKFLSVIFESPEFYDYFITNNNLMEPNEDIKNMNNQQKKLICERILERNDQSTVFLSFEIFTSVSMIGISKNLFTRLSRPEKYYFIMKNLTDEEYNYLNEIYNNNKNEIMEEQDIDEGELPILPVAKVGNGVNFSYGKSNSYPIDLDIFGEEDENEEDDENDINNNSTSEDSDNSDISGGRKEVITIPKSPPKKGGAGKGGSRKIFSLEKDRNNKEVLVFRNKVANQFTKWGFFGSEYNINWDLMCINLGLVVCNNLLKEYQNTPNHGSFICGSVSNVNKSYLCKIEKLSPQKSCCSCPSRYPLCGHLLASLQKLNLLNEEIIKGIIKYFINSTQEHKNRRKNLRMGLINAGFSRERSKPTFQSNSVTNKKKKKNKKNEIILSSKINYFCKYTLPGIRKILLNEFGIQLTPEQMKYNKKDLIFLMERKKENIDLSKFKKNESFYSGYLDKRRKKKD